jgi:hypothetical protein
VAASHRFPHLHVNKSYQMFKSTRNKNAIHIEFYIYLKPLCAPKSDVGLPLTKMDIELLNMLALIHLYNPYHIKIHSFHHILETLPTHVIICSFAHEGRLNINLMHIATISFMACNFHHKPNALNLNHVYPLESLKT